MADEDLMLRIGQRLRELRESANLNQEAVAEIADSSQQSVSRWENTGNIRLEALLKLSAHFGVPLSGLVEEDAHHEGVRYAAGAVMQSLRRLLRPDAPSLPSNVVGLIEADYAPPSSEHAKRGVKKGEKGP